jgi:hypothetical protein
MRTDATRDPGRPRRGAALLAAKLALLLLACGSAGAQERPNLVFLFSDDHAAHALSAYRSHLAYGAPLPATPNLDRLAASGMLFANAFVTNSICGPSRATVLTGQYGHLNGVMTNEEALHPTAVTFPGLLRGAGYETALFGKWHLKAEPAGFDHYEVLAGQGPYYNPVLRSARDSARHVGYTNDVITDPGAGVAGGRPEGARPFLMMLHFNAPHRFWDPGPEQLELFRDTLLAEPPTFWDDGSGRAFPTRDAEMTIALDLFARDLKLEAPENLTPEQRARLGAAYGAGERALPRAGLQGDDATRWRYQRYIKDYMRVVLAMDAAVGPGAGRAGTAGAGREHRGGVHLGPGLLPGRSRLVRQAVDVRGVAAHAAAGALAGSRRAGARSTTTWS